MQMQQISRSVCYDAFLATYGRGALVFALKWFLEKRSFKYEILPINGDYEGEQLFAVKFFPYSKDLSPGRDAYNRLCSLSDEQKNGWHETFGKHAGVSLEDYEQPTMRYPTNGAGT
jgi:hypothetical protein